jgi:hypothetical protein
MPDTAPIQCLKLNCGPSGASNGSVIIAALGRHTATSADMTGAERIIPLKCLKGRNLDKESEQHMWEDPPPG